MGCLTLMGDIRLGNGDVTIADGLAMGFSATRRTAWQLFRGNFLYNRWLGDGLIDVGGQHMARQWRRDDCGRLANGLLGVVTDGSAIVYGQFSVSQRAW